MSRRPVSGGRFGLNGYIPRVVGTKAFPPSMCGRQERTTKYAEYAKVEAGRIVVEIKAVKTLADEHRAQVIHCLKATGKPLGLPVTFGHSPKIEHQRFVNQPFSRLSRFS
jgi:hypothetical protein